MVIRIVLAIIVLGLSVYAMVTDNYELSPYMLFFLGCALLVMGISEIQAKRKSYAILVILASLFVLYVAVDTF
jgi:Protein of unknown function (DUF3953)